MKYYAFVALVVCAGIANSTLTATEAVGTIGALAFGALLCRYTEKEARDGK